MLMATVPETEEIETDDKKTEPDDDEEIGGEDLKNMFGF